VGDDDGGLWDLEGEGKWGSKTEDMKLVGYKKTI